jgi:tetratricopeptide (TPR) repeat protein
VQRPVERPGNRPGISNENRPSLRPIERPNTRPGDVTFPRPGRPGDGSITRPDIGRPGAITRPANPLPPGVTRPGDINRPGIGRPGEITRPDITRPGGITRPDNGRPGGITRPDIGRPGGIMRPDNERPSIGNRPDLGINNRPGNRPDRPGWGNEWGNWGDWNRPGNRPGSGPIFGNNNNININNNRWNWSYRPNYWGSRPWWGVHHHHHWHHGCWNYGWNSRHRRSSFASGFFWGVTTWGVGNLIFNSGYQTFVNPFPAPPVVNSAGTTIINYAQPITVAAADFPPGDEAAQAAADEKADAAMNESLAAFKKGDYPAALTAVDRALSVVPGDPAMHEFRALVFFAMGRFNDAAGVLNPVLASGPGWDWTTMTGLFDSQDTYAKLLRKLEEHHDANPDSAAANFLLGYHYLVLGHLEESYKLFSRSAELEPTDVVSASLRDLLRDSISSEEDEEAEAPAPIPVDPAKLVGTWISTRGDDGKITLVLKENGEFSWAFNKTGNAGNLAGEFAVKEDNLLVLSSPDSQLVGKVSFTDDSKLSFVLADGPRGDSGLTFDRQP